MKKFTLLLITVLAVSFFSSTLFAQDNDAPTKARYHEIGINATTFINKFISLNGNDVDLGDYMLTYKYHIGNKALRLGVGGQFSNFSEQLSNGGGNRDSKKMEFNFRVGYEWNKQVSKKWNFYAGLDIVSGISETVTQTNNSEKVSLTNKTSSFGAGPIMGIQFFINSHISLRTEGSLYYLHSSINNKEVFSVNTTLNSDTTDTANVTNFGLPTALFFVIRF